jgi:hypothetical protein
MNASTWPLELDPTANPDPYGAQSEPDAGETEDILAESAEIASCFTTDWKPSDETMALMDGSKGTFY